MTESTDAQERFDLKPRVESDSSIEDLLAHIHACHEALLNRPRPWTIWDEVVRFNDRYFDTWRKTDLVFLSNALAGEVGEICNDTKHLAGGGTNKRRPTYADLISEVADVYIYLVLLAEVLGRDEQEFADDVLTKVVENVKRMKAFR